MNYKVLIYVSIALVLASCSSAEDKKTAPSIYDEIELELNSGKKWNISDNMKVFMNQSSVLLAKNKDSQKELSKKLIELKESFVSSCDMEGDGHDVLHAWLIPYMGLLEDYENAKTADEFSLVKCRTWFSENNR